MLKKIILIIPLAILIFGCEDPIPKDYEKITIVEALLIIDEPIQNIRITKTMPLTELYNYDDAVIDDATVYIYEGEEEFELVFRYSDAMGKSGYYFPDTTYLVKRNTTYNLKIILPDGTNVTGTTTTPDSISWVKAFPKFVQYPLDSVNLPSDTSIYPEWTRSRSGNAFYFANITCLDTLEYGKYLSPSTDELNRRTYAPNRRERSYLELSVNAFVLSNRVPIPWRAFRWFGHHEIKIYVPDVNYEIWLMYVIMAGNLNEKAYTVKGCAGFFGSAFAIKDDFVLLKNQP